MNKPSVAICVATFKRPEGLKKLLRSVSLLDDSAASIQVIVVDNDIEASGEATVTQLHDSFPFEITYAVEAERGISHARNRLVALAREREVDFIASVDDDETVDELWVTGLVREAQRSGAAAVVGKHVKWLDEDVPNSFKHCYPTANVQTGRSLSRFSTANVLISVAALSDFPDPFDLRLNLSGGEDTLLSARFIANGHRIVKSNEAITFEYIPRSRANVRYILQRAFRTGITRSKIAQWVNPSTKTTTRHLLRSLGIIAKHAALIVPNAITNPDLLLFRVRCIVSGVGGIVGTIAARAYVPREYQTIHGS